MAPGSSAEAAQRLGRDEVGHPGPGGGDGVAPVGQGSAARAEHGAAALDGQAGPGRSGVVGVGVAVVLARVPSPGSNGTTTVGWAMARVGPASAPTSSRAVWISASIAPASRGRAGRVALGGPEHDVVEQRRQPGGHPGRRRHVVVDVLPGHVGRPVAVERHPAGEHLEQHDAGRVDVGAGVGAAVGASSGATYSRPAPSRRPRRPRRPPARPRAGAHRGWAG